MTDTRMANAQTGKNQARPERGQKNRTANPDPRPGLPSAEELRKTIKPLETEDGRLKRIEPHQDDAP